MGFQKFPFLAALVKLRYRCSIDLILLGFGVGAEDGAVCASNQRNYRAAPAVLGGT